MDDLDRALLRRLSRAGCHLRLAELADDDRMNLTAAEIHDRMERLEHLGYVSPLHSFKATPQGSVALTTQREAA